MERNAAQNFVVVKGNGDVFKDYGGGGISLVLLVVLILLLLKVV